MEFPVVNHSHLLQTWDLQLGIEGQLRRIAKGRQLCGILRETRLLGDTTEKKKPPQKQPMHQETNHNQNKI